ncbi:MAG: ribosome small subunit-dependent GTPase A [Clostridia bacterium]|nr:ribosome small subunit-dependent GTPase A [Clostridia bacterium]
MTEQLEGLIIKGVSGFYTVRAGGRLIECRARGVFRKEGITPLCGDYAAVSVEEDSATVTRILPRRNFLIRPPVANLDFLAIVSSAAEPEPNTLIIDKLIAVAELKSIEPVVVFTKTDLKPCAELADCYRSAGFPVFCVCPGEGEGVRALSQALRGRISAFTGNSGVGKSTLLNRLDPRLGLETGELSKKLNRGRHTTRRAELFELEGGGFIADTPGFSALDIERFEPVLKEDLQHCFREFAPLLDHCRFTGCNHIAQKGCAVQEAVESGRISATRYQSYIEMYNEVRGLKEWELKD